MGDKDVQFVGNIDVEDGRDEEGKGTSVVAQFLVGQGIGLVAVSAHRLDGNLVGYLNASNLAEIIYLREKVAEGLLGILHSLVATEDEGVVHHLVASLWLEVGEHQ